MAEKKVMGPASYFPSIEKKYGKPIEQSIVRTITHIEYPASRRLRNQVIHASQMSMQLLIYNA